jgi:uncharacterized small protein (DUF1192 family)
MSNWFEDNPVKSVIVHTIFIAATTWAVSTYVFQDNRIALLRSELDAQKALSEQYKTKSELLSKDLESVRAENVEYRNWLSESKDAVPAIMPRITELKSYIASLEAKVAKLPAAFSLNRDARRGAPTTDDKTGVVVEVQEVTVDKQAKLLVKFPDRDTKVVLKVKGGEFFPFMLGPVTYRLSILRVYYIADGIEFAITPEGVK